MPDVEKVIKGFECCDNDDCDNCPYFRSDDENDLGTCKATLHRDAIALMKKQRDEIKALRQLVDWAEECGFGLDNIYWEEYVTRDELDGMSYIDQLIYVAKKAGE